MIHRNISVSSGFTLIEILITVLIVGLLAMVAIPMYQDYLTRSRVTEALGFADSARTRVDITLMQGTPPPLDLLNNGGQKADMVTAMTWTPGVPGDALLGYILVKMDLPNIGERNVLTLERRRNGDWHCVSATNHGAKESGAG